MDLHIRFVPSAFKHGITREDIRHAVLNWWYDDIDADDPEKHLLIGFDSNVNILEIMYNVIDEQTIKVFHAMKCTREHRALLNP
jgi:uncharacterized DUF497 family protein